MVKREKAPHGYIYRATNIQNGKNYIGQTVASRWGDDKNPIEERWKEEVQEAYGKERRGESLRYVENAIVKHGPENFEVKEQDVAYSQEELDEKETDWIQEYDSMNPDKGYNMKEGGLGGKLGEVAKENLSNVISEKWQEDLEYQEKQLNARKELGQNQEFLEKMTEINRERAKNPEWLEKMTDVNQEIARNPETQEKMSAAISGKWQDQKYQESVSKGITGKWQESKYREKQFTARVDGKREIPDKGKFLKDIQEMKKKDLNTKYEMDGKCINRRIEEMLGHHGIKNFSQAKKYLEDKNLNEVLKDVNEKLNNQSQKFVGKKEISNKKEFLHDIQNKLSKEIEQKYDMGRTTVNKRIREMLGDHGVKNYTEAKTYLANKNLDEVVK